MLIKNRHFLSLDDYSRGEIRTLLDTAYDMKRHPEAYREALKGQVLAMIFEKSSTRTRVSFETGMYQLGGAAQFLSSRDIQLGRGEPISDTAAVLSRYVQGIMARTFAHQTVLDLAKFGTVPVINGLTDLEHPCQIMADLQTIREHFGTLQGLKMTYIGDGNNMAHSYMQGAGKVGMDCTIITPKDPKYYPNAEIIKGAEADHAAQGTKLVLTDDVMGGVAGSHIVITDTWISMGMEEEKAERMAATYSPTLWPMTKAGCTPQERHNSASAYSTANRAGWVQAVSSSDDLVPVAGYRISSSGLSSSGRRISAQRSSVRRKTGEVSYSSRPMPRYCEP